MAAPSLGTSDFQGNWLNDPAHRQWLEGQARDLLRFFAPSLREPAGFYVLDYAGAPLPTAIQELHTTTRMVHSYALGTLANLFDGSHIIDHGLAYLASHHQDKEHGGYLWALNGDAVSDSRKLAYGHVFVLLAGASAHAAGHPDALALIDRADAVLDRHFWDDEAGLFADEWARDWSPFSTYRGMNANMHGVEALLSAYEATGRQKFLDRAGRILDFFMRGMAPRTNWRLPEHYTQDWQVDAGYSGDPMFRPAGTTPGHSFELARLLLQHWDLCGRPDDDSLKIARNVTYRALEDGWDKEKGGVIYTLNFDGTPAIRSRYWWPATEAIGVLAALQKCDADAETENWYRRIWAFCNAHFVDHHQGAWFPEIDEDNAPTHTQFAGKPDIYHALQAALLPLTPGLSRAYQHLPALGDAGASGSGSAG